jgi:GNAT superfamily N-acetyltransferase
MREYPQLSRLELADLGDHLYLNVLEVKPEFRGQGVGTKVLKRVKDYARERGLKLALVPHPLSAEIEKPRLVQFYRHMGFKGTRGPLAKAHDRDTLVMAESSNYWIVPEKDHLDRVHQLAKKHGARFGGGDKKNGYTFHFADPDARQSFATAVRIHAKRAGNVDG